MLANKLYLIYILFFIVLVVDRIKTSFVAKSVERGTTEYYPSFQRLLVSAYLFIIFSAVTEFLILSRINLIAILFGLFFLLISRWVRISSVVALNGQWCLSIRITKNDKLIKTGIYKSLAHPYHVSVLVELIGFCLISGAWFALLMVFLIQLPLIYIRILLEEKILNSIYGIEYHSYRVTKLI